MRLSTALLLLLALAVPAAAVEPNERLADPKLEARARAVSAELRCLVCQNESIDESGADLAHDIRVLLKPPVEPVTYLLWFGPFALLVVAGAGMVVALRRRHAAAEPPPLDDAEKERLERLMRETEA